MTHTEDGPISPDQALQDSAPPRRRFDWSAARIALVRQRWSEGLSAASIAKELGEGISRCAVLGKIHRLKLPQPEFKRQHPRKERAAVKRKRPRRLPTHARAPSALMAAFRALGLDGHCAAGEIGNLHQHAAKAFGPACSLMELGAATCRWPVGEPDQADFAFCGAAPFKRYPYCLRHCLIAYRPDAADETAGAPSVPRPAPAPHPAPQPRFDQRRRHAA